MNKYLLMLLMLVCANAHSALNKWVDANGQVYYSDTPPPANAKARVLPSTSRISGHSGTDDAAASSAAAPKTIAERETDLKKAQQAKKEAVEKSARQQAATEANRAGCVSLQQNLRALQEGVRMTEFDADGNRYFLDDEQRQQRIAKTQQDINTFCK